MAQEMREKLISVTGPWEGGHCTSCRVTVKEHQCGQETEVRARGMSRPGPYLGFPWERQRKGQGKQLRTS